MSGGPVSGGVSTVAAARAWRIAGWLGGLWGACAGPLVPAGAPAPTARRPSWLPMPSCVGQRRATEYRRRLEVSASRMCLKRAPHGKMGGTKPTHSVYAVRELVYGGYQLATV